MERWKDRKRKGAGVGIVERNNRYLEVDSDAQALDLLAKLEEELGGDDVDGVGLVYRGRLSSGDFCSGVA
jgi:hypothetical protein